MSIRRLGAIIRKEFRHIRRDRRLLFLVTVSPAIMLVAFAYLFSFDTVRIPFAYYDRDRSAESRRLLMALTTDHRLRMVGEAAGYDDLRAAMQAGRVRMGLVIPPGFGADLVAGRTTTVQLLGDGSDPITAAVQMARLAGLITEWGLSYRRLNPTPPVEVRALVWFNPFLRSSHSMVPALLAIVLILPGMAVALALTREKELGSFESLAATPVRPAEYILGKLIPYLVYGLIGAAGAVAVALFWFRVPLRGSALDLAGMTLVYLLATLGITTFVAGFMATQSTALRAVLLLFLVPSVFLSGILLPVDPQTRLTAESLPATHFVVIARGLFLKGQSWQALGRPLFILAMMALLSLTFSILTLRKRVDW
jgi:ABC-2 type transport system permease protein